MFKITKTKRNFIGLHTLYAIVSSVIGILCLHRLFPGHYFNGYPLIPLFFYGFGLISIYAFDVCRRKAPQKLLLLYMALKVIKMLLSILWVIVYCPIVRQEAHVFLLTFISFYLVYLIFETWFYFTFEVNWKQKKLIRKKNESVA